MDNQEYVFTPEGDQPTVQNLRRSTFKMIAFIAVGCAFSTYFLKPSKEIDALVAFVLLSFLVIIVVYPARYIQNIRIDPKTHKLYAGYLKMNGKTGITVIDLDLARINYKFNFTKTSSGWSLTLNDGTEKLKLYETKSTTSKDQKNSFLKDQLDSINEVINHIKNGNLVDQHS